MPDTWGDGLSAKCEWLSGHCTNEGDGYYRDTFGRVWWVCIECASRKANGLKSIHIPDDEPGTVRKVMQISTRAKSQGEAFRAVYEWFSRSVDDSKSIITRVDLRQDLQHAIHGDFIFTCIVHYYAIERG